MKMHCKRCDTMSEVGEPCTRCNLYVPTGKMVSSKAFASQVSKQRPGVKKGVTPGWLDRVGGLLAEAAEKLKNPVKRG